MIFKNDPNSFNKQGLYFSGTDYLGMQSNVDFIKIVQNNLERWGTCYGSSRDANVKLSIYDEFENYFADFLNSDAVLSVSSGTVAGILVKEQFDESVKRFHILNSHPAVVFKNSNSVFISGKINPLLLTSSSEQVIISTDAIIALTTHSIAFDFLDEIHPHKKVILIVDESHSLGVLGENGSGILSQINHSVIEQKICISSLSKAYGVSGGIIVSDVAFIDRVKLTSLFSGSAGANPAFLQSVLDGKELCQQQLIKLKENLTYFYENLESKSAFKFSLDYPVVYYPNELKNRLLKHNIITTNFNYQGNDINRIVIKANFSFEELDLLLGVLNA